MRFALSLSVLLSLGSFTSLGCSGDDGPDDATVVDAAAPRDAGTGLPDAAGRDAQADAGADPMDALVVADDATAPDALVNDDATAPDAVVVVNDDAALPDAVVVVNDDAALPDAVVLVDAAAPDLGMVVDAGFPDAAEPRDALVFPDAEEPVDSGPAPAVTFTQVYSQVIQANCSCHVLGASGGLQMGSANTAYTNLVNVRSQGYSPSLRVAPADPVSSVLYGKITGTNFGNQMPLGGPLLSSADVALIEQWINDGALR